MSDDVQILLGLGLQREVDVGVEDALLAGVRTLDELFTHRGVDHAESTAASRSARRVLKVVDLALLLALLANNLRADHHEASPLEGDDLRKTHAHHVCDVSRPIRVLSAGLVGRVRPKDGPARNMQVDVLLVLVVPQHDLGMLPAVEAADFDVRVSCAWSHGLERFTLAVAPVGALDVSGLDLAAVVDDDAVLVDERLGEKLAPSEMLFRNVNACLGDVQGILVPFAVPKHDKHSGFLDGGADPLHLIRVLDKRVAEVLVHEAGIFCRRPSPNTPLDVSD